MEHKLSKYVWNQQPTSISDRYHSLLQSKLAQSVVCDRYHLMEHLTLIMQVTEML